MSFCSLLFCHMRQPCCFCLSQWSPVLHCVCLAFLEGSLACINLCHGWQRLRMLFQMRSMSSVAFNPFCAGQVLLGASSDYVCFFVIFISSGAYGPLGSIRDKRSLLYCDFFWFCVISTSHWYIFFFACHH